MKEQLKNFAFPILFATALVTITWFMLKHDILSTRKQAAITEIRMQITIDSLQREIATRKYLDSVRLFVRNRR